jgi:hypothetical protein
MRFLVAFGIAGLLAGCASHDATPAQHWIVTYYDRNGDGVVDYELHTLGSGHADADWALIDRKFSGHYDLRIHWGYVVEKKKVDIPVPKKATITPGKPLTYHAV